MEKSQSAATTRGAWYDEMATAVNRTVIISEILDSRTRHLIQVGSPIALACFHARLQMHSPNQTCMKSANVSRERSCARHLSLCLAVCRSELCSEACFLRLCADSHLWFANSCDWRKAPVWHCYHALSSAQLSCTIVSLAAVVQEHVLQCLLRMRQAPTF